MLHLKKSTRTAMASAELILAAAFWGLGFTAAVWALESFSAPTITALRFALAVLLVLVFGLARPRHLLKNFDLNLAKLSFLPGLYLAALLVLQTWGLQYTTATKSSFITCLYAVMVPLGVTLMGRARFHWTLWIWVITAMGGTVLMLDASLTGLNKGDLITFVSSLFATLHIIKTGQVAPQVDRPYLFNAYQSFWSCLVAMAALPFFPEPHIRHISWLAVAGILILAVFSTFLGFAIQVKTQKVVSEAHASLIFLLESPFALLFAIVFLREHPSWVQLTGCAVIFLSACAATVFESRRRA